MSSRASLSISLIRARAIRAGCSLSVLARCGSRSASAAASILLWQAQRNPNVGSHRLRGVRGRRRQSARRYRGAEGLGNIRLHADDARALLRWLPAGCLSRVFILFPDPWPKKRHASAGSFAGAVARRCCPASWRPGAELRIATDVGDYARSMLLAARERPERLRLAGRAGRRTGASGRHRLAATRYEAKALAEGRRCYFFRFRKPVAP